MLSHFPKPKVQYYYPEFPSARWSYAPLKVGKENAAHFPKSPGKCYRIFPSAEVLLWESTIASYCLWKINLQANSHVPHTWSEAPQERKVLTHFPQSPLFLFTRGATLQSNSLSLHTGSFAPLESANALSPVSYGKCCALSSSLKFQIQIAHLHTRGKCNKKVLMVLLLVELRSSLQSPVSSLQFPTACGRRINLHIASFHILGA